jgi:tetratricopeptide (TPR) repeat protein
MVRITVVLAVAWLAAFALGSPPVGWTLLGATIVMAEFAHVARRPDDACSFCHASREQVQVLIAARAVSICEQCLSLSMAAAAEDLQGRQPPRPWLRHVVDGLPRNCPRAVSRPLLEAMADGSTDPATLREVAGACGRLSNDEVAAEMLQRIPESDRGTMDWLSLGAALGRIGRPREALAATEAALKVDDGTHRAACLNNRVWHGIRHQSGAPADTRAAWLRDLDEARRLLDEKRPPGWQPLMQCLHGTEAEVRSAGDDLKGALQALAEAEKLGPFSGERHLIRARAFARAGEPLGRADAQKVLELVHPESLEAIEARALLSRFDREGR